METITLEAQSRQMNVKAKALRGAGSVPGVVYGVGFTPVPVAVEYQAFRKVYLKAGANTIINLSVAGKEHAVLVKEISYDPVSDAFSHIDFYKLDMNKMVTSLVKIEVVGIAPAVKNLGGILDIQKHEIKVKCLPKDLIHSIPVDVTSIEDFHTSIHVKDLKVPSSITILDNAEDTVVTASHIKVEEARPTGAAPAEGAAAATPAEGAAAPAADKK